MEDQLEDQLFQRSMAMEMYYLEQASDLYQLYADKLDEEIKYGGHANMHAYMMQLEIMDDENRKDWEKRLWSEIVELRMIKADMKALQQAL